MLSLAERIKGLVSEGYTLDEARAKVAHDSILYAVHKSGFTDRVTIKGGVVMCALTKNHRRTTMDIDLDLMHVSISDDSIVKTVSQWSNASGMDMEIVGQIQELRQDDYRGKRIYLTITDGSIPAPVRTKVDIGVQANEVVPQAEMNFDATGSGVPVKLQVNSKEQIFTEKLLSFLLHGVMSTRTKDLFDMYYLKDDLDPRSLQKCLSVMIFENERYQIDNMKGVIDIFIRIFKSKRILNAMTSTKSNWLNIAPAEVVTGILDYLKQVYPIPSSQASRP